MLSKNAAKQRNKYYIKLIKKQNKLHKMFMKTQDIFWYMRYKNLRDA